MASFISSLDSKYGSSTVIEVSSDSPRKRRTQIIVRKRNEAAGIIFWHRQHGEAMERGWAGGGAVGFAIGTATSVGSKSIVTDRLDFG